MKIIRKQLAQTELLPAVVQRLVGTGETREERGCLQRVEQRRGGLVHAGLLAVLDGDDLVELGHWLSPCLNLTRRGA